MNLSFLAVVVSTVGGLPSPLRFFFAPPPPPALLLAPLPPRGEPTAPAPVAAKGPALPAACPRLAASVALAFAAATDCAVAAAAWAPWRSPCAAGAEAPPPGLLPGLPSFGDLPGRRPPSLALRPNTDAEALTATADKGEGGQGVSVGATAFTSTLESMYSYIHDTAC